MSPTEKEIAYTAQLKGSLRLSGEGKWFHNGAQFQNEKLSDLFLRSIVCDEQTGEYFVEIGNQRATFSCDDTAYFILGINDGTDPWILHLSNGSSEPFNPETLSAGTDGTVYCFVKGSKRAKLLKPAHQTLAQYVTGDNEISINGKTYSL